MRGMLDVGGGRLHTLASTVTKKKPPPTEHPVAWQSALWPHLQLIRELRVSRKTWPQIAEHLKAEKGVALSHRTIRNFFKRARHAKPPLGFESSPASPAPRQETAPAPLPQRPADAPAPEGAPQPRPDAYWQAVAGRETNPFTADKLHNPPRKNNP